MYFVYANQRTAKRIFIQRIFAFSAFFLLAPKCAQREVSRSRKVEKRVFASGKRFAKTFRAKIGLFRKKSRLSAKNRVFSAKNRVFPAEIRIFASVSARKYLLAHFSIQRIYGYQRLFPFSAFFSIQRQFTIFASVSARKYLLAHFSIQRIYGYQRLFPFSAFFFHLAPFSAKGAK